MGDAQESRPAPTDDLLEVVRQAQAGSAQAWDRLAGDLRPRLKELAERALHGRGGGLDDPSDIVQNSLLAVYQHLGEFRGNTEPELHGWLRAIVGRKSKDKVRYDHQPRRDERQKQALPQDSSGTVPLAADASTPSQKAVRREEEGQREEAFRRLSADDQQVLQLRFRERRPWSEVAQAMSRSEDAVKQLYHRAAKRWKQQMEDTP